MSRWHRPTCMQPDVVVAGGLPCCRFCDAVGCIDNITFALPLSTVPQAPSDESNGCYQLRWPAGVDYKHDDEPPGAPSSLFACSNPSARFQDQRGSNNHGGPSSTFQNNRGKLDDSTQVQHGQTASESNPYKPSRCYPVFWSDDEIRLLELDSSGSGSLLHGAFSRVRLGSEQAQYEAVSYTWADESTDSTRCRPMFIGPFWDIIPITRNCENALRSVRISGGPPRKVWIDSLCINQDDEEERSAQVALMPRIYTGAAGVLIYLGPASQDSDLALDVISRSVHKNECVHSNADMKVACEKCAEAVKSLFQRAFFRRLWVVQEVTLAKSLMIFCGSKSTFWPFDHITKNLPVSVWTRVHDKRADDPGWELLGLMTETSRCFCGDPRDHIFALLGMIRSLNEKDIAADYGLTFQEVSIGIASFLAQKCGRGREVLLFGGINRGKRRQLPTWVPDFVEPLRPDWRIRGLLDRSLAISGDPVTAREAAERLERADRASGIRRDRLSFQPLETHDIQINSRTSCLQLQAIKLSNFKSSFKPSGTGPDFQPFVRYGSTQRAVILVPRAPGGSRHPSSWLEIISAEDGLYWLYGIEGFAILRPNYDGVTHSLICGCDVVLEPVGHSGTWKQPLSGPFDWSTPLERLSESEENLCSSQLPRLFQQLPSSFEASNLHAISKSDTSDVEARDFLLDIAFALNHSQYQAESMLWESWKRMERSLLPLFKSERGLETLQHCITGVTALPLSNEENGMPRHLYALKDCHIQSFEAIAGLIWSLLPSWELYNVEEEEAESPDRPTDQILRDLRDWADLTVNLLSAIDSPSSTYLPHILPCSGIREHWQTQWTRFQQIMRPSSQPGLAQQTLSLFPRWKKTDADEKLYLHLAAETELFWDWGLLDERMTQQRAFWEIMEGDEWLKSWRLRDQQGLPKIGTKVLQDEEKLKFQKPTAAPGQQTPPGSELERKMALRLRLREFGFNVDSRIDVAIR